MKKGIIVFFRVTFVLLAMLVALFFSLKYYYLYQSRQAIAQSLTIGKMPVIGEASRPFTIVEFFDYRCPHCSTLSRVVDEAVDHDPKIKIILRPTVMRDEQSGKIAELVLAAERQKTGTTLLLHKKIMDLPDIPDYDTVISLAKAEGIDIKQAEKDGAELRPQILMNTKLIGNIGFYGVPALIIGDKGYVPKSDMPGINELRLMILDAKKRLKVD